VRRPVGALLHRDSSQPIDTTAPTRPLPRPASRMLDGLKSYVPYSTRLNSGPKQDRRENPPPLTQLSMATSSYVRKLRSSRLCALSARRDDLRFAIPDERFTITGSPAILVRRGTDDMSMQTNLEALIKAAQHLTREEQQKLLDALRSAQPLEPRHRITEMRGLGKDLWRGVDPRDYLNAERDSWDN
jgi:hypothetical protein